MSYVRSTIAIAAALSISAAQMLCLCGPTGVASTTESYGAASAPLAATGHEHLGMTGHEDMSGDASTTSCDHHNGGSDCFYCADTVSVTPAHVDLISTDGKGEKCPELVMVVSYATRQMPTPIVIERSRPPPDAALRAPETLVSLKTLLLT